MIVEAGGEDCIICVKIGPHVVNLGNLECFTWLNLQHRSRKPLLIVASIGRPFVGKTVHAGIGAIAGDIATTRSAVGIDDTILHRVTVCSCRIHFHRSFEHSIRALDDIHRPKIGLCVGVISWEDDVGGLSPTRLVKCGNRHGGENCGREELLHSFRDLPSV